MLDKVRTNVKSFGVQFVIILVVVAFIGTIFLVWGHGGKSERQEVVLAKVYDLDITYPEYQQEYIQLVNQYRQMYKNQWSEDLAQKLQIKRLAFNNLVDQYILLHKAQEWGMTISESEITDYIKSLPVFQVNGSFSPDAYHQRLEMARITPEKFESDIKRHLLFTRIQERISAGFKVTDDEIMDEFAKNNEKLRADYILFPSERFISTLQMSLDELKKYYDTHKEKYRLAERRSIEYLFIQPKDFEADASITDDEIKTYYEQHESAFYVPKQVKASHILVKAPPNVSPEEDNRLKNKAIEILEKIKAGEEFHELARKYSECPSAPKGGDLGYFGKGKMDPAFEKAAFALNIGEVSQVVKSSFGYHVIKAEDVKPEKLMTLEEARDVIIRQLQQSKGKELAFQKAEFIERELYKGKFVRDFAFEKHVTYKEVGPFNQEEDVTGLSRTKELIDEIFRLEMGKFSRIIETPKGDYIIRVTKIDPPRESTYTEVETQVEKDAKGEKAVTIARAEAEKVRKKIMTGADMESVAKEYALMVSDTGEIKQGGYISGLGNLEEAQIKTLFSLNKGEVSPAIEHQRGIVVFKIKEKVGFSKEAFAREKDSIMNHLLQLKQQELFTSWIERVKKEANLQIVKEDLLK